MNDLLSNYFQGPISHITIHKLRFNFVQNYNIQWKRKSMLSTNHSTFECVFQNQWQRYKGKCGICGDPWQGPRENEAGGKYANGIITARFTAGQVIDVTIQITANHKGWHEFRLCRNNNYERVISQECLDR